MYGEESDNSTVQVSAKQIAKDLACMLEKRFQQEGLAAEPHKAVRGE